MSYFKTTCGLLYKWANIDKQMLYQTCNWQHMSKHNILCFQVICAFKVTLTSIRMLPNTFFSGQCSMSLIFSTSFNARPQLQWMSWGFEPYQVVPLESKYLHGICVNIASFFYTIETPICYVGCLMITNTWTYISLYIRNTAILENKKSVSIFPHQLVNTCDLHIHTL